MLEVYLSQRNAALAYCLGGSSRVLVALSYCNFAVSPSMCGLRHGVPGREM